MTETEAMESEPTTSNNQSSESQPTPLFPRKRGRKSYAQKAAEAGMPLNEWLETQNLQPQRQKNPTAANQTTQSDGRRIFPDNGAEQERILKRYRPYAQMIVGATSKVCEVAQVQPLDSAEKENGTNAFAQLLYEEEANLSARFLVLVFLLTTFVPRLMEYLDKRQKKSATPLEIMKAKIEEKEVKGERVA